MSDRAQERDEAISAYLLGELDDAERAEFERRLAREPALRAEVEALRPVVRGLAAMPQEAWKAPEPPPLSLPVSEISEARVKRSPPRARGWRWTPARAALAGAVAAAFLGAGVWIGTLVDDDPPGPSPTPSARSR